MTPTAEPVKISKAQPPTNEIYPNENGGDCFDRDGWVIGRNAFPPDLVREVRAPIVYELTSEGLIEAVPGEADRFRWTGTVVDAMRNGNGSAITHRYRDTAAFRPLVEHGHARRVAERLWGRPALLWANTALFPKVPEVADPAQSANIGHSDGWQNVGSVPSGDHFNLWVPLTEFGPFEGALAMHADSYRNRPERYPTVPHGGIGPEQLEDGWRVGGYRVGDAILFRPDIVHHSTMNSSPYLRLAIVIRGQRADALRAPAAGMSYDLTQPMSTLEGLILALLAAAPHRSPAIGREFAPRGLIGRFYPLPAPGQLSPEDVIRQALHLLRLRGLIDTRTEPDQPRVVQYAATAEGTDAALAWLAEPVRHVEELASVVPAKLALLDALAADPAEFTAAQRQALDRLDAAETEEPDRIAAVRKTAMIAATHAILAG